LVGAATIERMPIRSRPGRALLPDRSEELTVEASTVVIAEMSTPTSSVTRGRRWRLAVLRR